MVNFEIIFTTAYDHYAIQAFKQNSVDYLLKPISLKDLSFSIEKFKKQQISPQKQLIENITMAYQQLNTKYKTRFLVKLGQSIDSIPTDEIHHFETQESISFLITNQGSRFAIEYSLDQLEDKVSPKEFFRINRKIILHIKAIEKAITYFNGRILITTKFLQGDAKVVSRERVNDFKAWLDN